MTTLQAWILIVEVGIIALAYLVGLFRGLASLTMAKTVPVEVRVADLPQMQQFISSVAALLKALAKCGEVPDPVMAAADQLRRDLVALGGRDIGPPPWASDEGRIRDAMAEAHDHPGRTITR